MVIVVVEAVVVVVVDGWWVCTVYGFIESESGRAGRRGGGATIEEDKGQRTGFWVVPRYVCVCSVSVTGRVLRSRKI